MNIDNLKRARENTGLTQSQVADMLGISDGTYKNYEQGKREPNNTLLLKIADLYGVTTDYLLGREPAPAPVDPFEVLGFKKTVDDDEFVRLYNTLPDFAKQIFVDTMAKLAQATTDNLKKQSTRPPHPVKPPQAPDSTIVQSTSQILPRSVVNESTPKTDIQISQMMNSEFAIARGGNGMYKPAPTDEQIASFTPVPEDSGL